MNWLIASHVGLFAAVVALGVVVLSLARQIGVLHERTAPAGATLGNIRRSQPSDPHSLAVTNLVGSTRPLGDIAAGRALAILFIGPDCPVCKAIVPRFEPELRHLDLLPCYVGGSEPLDTQRRYAEQHALEPEFFFVGIDLAMALQVMQTPTLVVIDSGGQVASRKILRGPAHLQSTTARLRRAQRPDGTFAN